MNLVRPGERIRVRNVRSVAAVVQGLLHPAVAEEVANGENLGRGKECDPSNLHRMDHDQADRDHAQGDDDPSNHAAGGDVDHQRSAGFGGLGRIRRLLGEQEY